MPSTSAKQAKFMRAVANSPKFAKKVGVPQSVGKDFEMADKKMKKFSDGGQARKSKPPMPREPITGGSDTVPLTPERKKFLEELRRRQAEAAASERPKPAKKPMAKGGKVMKHASKAGNAMKKKSADTMGRAMKKYSKGGGTYGPPASGSGGSSAGPRGGLSSASKNYRLQDLGPPPTAGGDGNTTIKPSLRGGMPGFKVKSKFAKGGLASGHKAANGIAKKGLTKGKEVKMNKGGACYAKGGSVDGIAKKGKTKGKMC